MKYRRLGKTNLSVSEIGLGAEWLERMDFDGVKAIIDAADAEGINILDCWMPEPNVRTNIGKALAGRRERWYIQGHLGSTWQNGQYVRTREMNAVIPAFKDLMERLQTDYINLGMIHYVDSEEDWNNIMNGPFIEYVRELKSKGVIHHVGLSSHNPEIAMKAVNSGEIEMLLFSVNPAFDLQPPADNLMHMLTEEYDESLMGMNPARARLYSLCEQKDIGITVMKGFAGGRLLKAETSPFCVAMTPVQCIHYALTRPATASILCGYSDPAHVKDAVQYETASEAEKDYSAVLASAPKHAYSGKCMYCNHCKPCTMDIDIAMVNKLYDLAIMQESVPASVKAHYRALPVTADDCVFCGSCEPRCPFHVPIMERMQKAKELFS